MRTIAIEGINGSGKSPAIDLIVQRSSKVGIFAKAYAPYHLVREKIDEPDIYPLWRERPCEAVKLLHETIAEIEADARDQRLDLLIFDRHWLTAYTQAERNPCIAELWGDTFVPTILFTSPLEHTLRLSQRGYTMSWLQAENLTNYLELYETLYQRHRQLFIGKFTVSSSTQNLSPIADQIISIAT